VHAMNFILGALGDLDSHEDDEVDAYIVQHIVEAVENKLKNKTPGE